MRESLWDTAAFCGVEVLSYVLMSNHFHLLVRVPDKVVADAELDDETLLKRVERLYGEDRAGRLRGMREAYLSTREAARLTGTVVVDSESYGPGALVFGPETEEEARARAAVALAATV